MKPLRIREADHIRSLRNVILARTRENECFMLRTLIDIISRPYARERLLQRVAVGEPLKRLAESELAHSKPLATIAKGLAKHTKLMIESLFVDEDISDWRAFGLRAGAHQIEGLAIFCSTCIVHLTLRDLQNPGLGQRLDLDLKPLLDNLVRTMYGDFARQPTAGILTFSESLDSGDLQEPEDVKHLALLLDGFMHGDPEPKISALKAGKLQQVLKDHRRGFAYTLHSAL